ncbi:uncharacterized protein SCHCODRAFT_02627293 [Schizophyllum commune H4-8]|uniref:uncharacterized protein n=1 Tax=Schizophyllum commune (strain H4-8 / FGSC 9210) TaxID=578458 RepID=UPI00215E6A72|nr:uncharacterized protein SCHCODRAFT_02627293 [Schizophyllum commune H4-8]KAI5892852.1 hypothetical protein SCHCODRAFT_02627293 [Schizophyllum commune H4-8]
MSERSGSTSSLDSLCLGLLSDDQAWASSSSSLASETRQLPTQTNLKILLRTQSDTRRRCARKVTQATTTQSQ